MKHKSVLLDEVIKYLNVSEGKTYIDATVGYAGHSGEVLKKLNKKGFLFAFDQDDEAIEYSNIKLSEIADNFKIIKSNFSNMKDYIKEPVDGIMFDLGVSSPQLDEEERGFSFHKDAPLDMRMDTTKKLSAYEVVNNYSKEDLIRIFRDYGEEVYASSIANSICLYRGNKKIISTLELVDIIEKSVPFKYKREHHPARKVFQAIRIEVNDELNVFEKSLRDALELLNVGGRICVITFHSLEDKICKETFKEVSSIPNSMKHMPVIPKEYEPKFKVVKTVTPTDEEIERNPRSRSAKLRVIERI
jgi:16S rRNA (cytosine1402-N4)-methyltransferase